LGSEREGLTPEQAAACDLVVRLPMLGHATSLNLAVATAVGFLFNHPANWFNAKWDKNFLEHPPPPAAVAVWGVGICLYLTVFTTARFIVSSATAWQK
jgi:hypothetical protein